MKDIQLRDLFLSFHEIWKYDKRLLFIMIADVIVDATYPFPNIVFSGLIVDSIVDGRNLLRVILYVALLFGSIFIIMSVRTLLGKVREYQMIKFINSLNNEINRKCLDIDFEIGRAHV